MKKLYLFLFLFSFNLSASEFYNHLNKTSPSLMDFGLLKIELEVEREKNNISKSLKSDIEFAFQQEYKESSIFDINNYFKFPDSLVIDINKDKLDYFGKYDHKKEKIILRFDIQLRVTPLEYEDFVIENYKAIEPKILCNNIREVIKSKLNIWGGGKRGKIHFFNEFFAHTGKGWAEEFVKDENTNLVVQLHYDYWRDKSPGLSTTVCLGDIGSEPTYKEFDFYLLDNLLESIKFAESF